MSYLDPTRLHFAGRFQANVSTVNNDPAHFNIETFKPEYQEWGSGSANGWWNPEGSGDWRLIGCKVTGAWIDGSAAADDDLLLECIVADSDSEVPGKLVDLDPDQQLVSQIWGMTVRIASKDGRTLMSGKFEPCAFFDLWSRATGGGAAGDMAMGTQWQSVLTDVLWADDLSGSAALVALQRSSMRGMLSIKFNVDGYNMTYDSANFTTGRIVGTIGPYFAGEPRHLLRGRQLAATMEPQSITPSGALNYCSLTLHPDKGFTLIDLGNALPTDIPGGPPSDLGNLSLGYAKPGSGDLVTIADFGGQYPAKGWYESTAGIVQVDVSGSADEYDKVALAIFNAAGTAQVVENPGHAYVQSDQIVARMSPGDATEFQIHAVRNGAPLANAAINISPNPQWPDATGVLSYPPQITTDADGIAALKVTAFDPGTPRWVPGGGAESGPDGQIYGLTPAFADPDLAAGAVDSWNFISFHVYSAWAPASDPPTWDDIQPVMQQYANLYPVMARFLNLADLDSVKGNLFLLKLAFELPMDNPNHMPVTRDLSPAKRKAILQVLNSLGSEKAAGEAVPRPPAAGTKRLTEAATAAEDIRAEAVTGPVQGGKTAALIRAGILPQSEGDNR